MKLASMVVGLTMIAGVAQAQTVLATLTAPYAPGGTPLVSPYGYYMSPYSGTVDGGPEYRFNCVDYFHEVAVGQTWTANTTNLGDMLTALQTNNSSVLDAMIANTRGGDALPPGDAVKMYQEAALLTTMFATDPGSDPVRSSAIQTAIWTLTNSNFATTGQSIGSGASSENDTGFWVNYAANNYDNQSSGFYNQFSVLTDVTHATGGTQEFIYATTSTPEPATLTLFATGLFAVGGVGVKRRRKGLANTVQMPV